MPANATLAIDDVLATKFGTIGAGGIRVESTGTTPQAVWVLSQTLVVNARSSTGVPGTNGFAIPAQNTEQLVALGETAYVPYVSSSSSGSSGYRTNLFLLSANGTGSTVVTVTLLKGDGTVLGTRDVTLARYAQTQINGIAASFGYTANDTNLTATVKVKSGGPVATGASVIDNAIASISYSPPVKVAIANNGAFGIVLNDPYGAGGRLDIVDGNGDFIYGDDRRRELRGRTDAASASRRSARRTGPRSRTRASSGTRRTGPSRSRERIPNSTFSGTILSCTTARSRAPSRTRAPPAPPAPRAAGRTATYAYLGAKVFKLP